jgi:hypothetical protein
MLGTTAPDQSPTARIVTTTLDLVAASMRLGESPIHFLMKSA